MDNPSSSTPSVIPLLNTDRPAVSGESPAVTTQRPWWRLLKKTNYHQPGTLESGIEMDNGLVKTRSTSSQESTKSQEPRYKWIKGIHIACGVTFVVLIINIILTVIASGMAYSKFDGQGFSYATIYRGSCKRSENWTTGLHLVINILSTIALAASSYCMQCLSAPSREEIDQAHEQRIWLHVGTASLQNLWFIPVKRRILWCVLLFTSLPFHNIYNSAVFPSKNFNSFEFAFAAADSDLKAISVDSDTCFEQGIGQSISKVAFDLTHGGFEHWDKEKCAQKIQDARQEARAGCTNCAPSQGMILLLSNEDTGANRSVLYQPHLVEADADADGYLVSHRLPWEMPTWGVEIPAPNGTLTFSPNNYTQLYHSLPGGDDELLHDMSTLGDYVAYVPSPREAADATKIQTFLDNSTNWQNATWASDVSLRQMSICTSETDLKPGNWSKYQVDGCLSQKVPDKCELLFSLPFCLVVIACNTIKVICMLLAVNDDRSDVILTVGDAIASFLNRPDSTTKGRCLLSTSTVGQRSQHWKEERLSWKPSRSSQAKGKESMKGYAERLPEGKIRWHRAAASSQWGVTITLLLLCLGTSGFVYWIIFYLSVTYEYWSPSLWHRNIDSIPSGIATGQMDSSPLPIILLANTPQLIMSTLYFLYNNLLTHMLLAVEYADYSCNRKSLRVSFPKDSQRSTYYLTVPYRYSVPLLVGSVLVHWLLSQSVYYTRLVHYDKFGNLSDYSVIDDCEFTALPMLFFIGFLIIMLVVAFILGFRRFKGNMPLAGNCSAAISAACHPPEDDRDAALKKVMWGEVESSGGTNGVERQDQDGNPGREQTEDTESMTLPNTVSEPKYRHCSFTSYEVVTPCPTRLYT